MVVGDGAAGVLEGAPERLARGDAGDEVVAAVRDDDARAGVADGREVRGRDPVLEDGGEVAVLAGLGALAALVEAFLAVGQLTYSSIKTSRCSATYASV